MKNDKMMFQERKKIDLNYQLTKELPLTSQASKILEQKSNNFRHIFWPVVDHRWVSLLSPQLAKALALAADDRSPWNMPTRNFIDLPQCTLSDQSKAAIALCWCYYTARTTLRLADAIMWQLGTVHYFNQFISFNFASTALRKNL